MLKFNSKSWPKLNEKITWQRLLFEMNRAPAKHRGSGEYVHIQISVYKIFSTLYKCIVGETDLLYKMCTIVLLNKYTEKIGEYQQKIENRERDGGGKKLDTHTFLFQFSLLCVSHSLFLLYLFYSIQCNG